MGSGFWPRLGALVGRQGVSGSLSGPRLSLWEGTPERVSEWEEPLTHLEEFLVGCKGWYWWGRKEKWLTLGLPGLFASTSLGSGRLGVAQGVYRHDATSQVPGSLWTLLHFDLSTPTAWPQRRATQASPPSLGTHLLNSGCHPGGFHLYCFPSLGPQFEGRWDQDD